MSITILTCLPYSSTRSKVSEILSIASIQYLFSICSIKIYSTIYMNNTVAVKIPYSITNYSHNLPNLIKAIFSIFSEPILP
jgi:hypothetical protein